MNSIKFSYINLYKVCNRKPVIATEIFKDVFDETKVIVSIKWQPK